MLTITRQLWLDETGVATFETAVTLALVAAVAVLSWCQLGHGAHDTMPRNAPQSMVATRPN